MKRSAVSSNSTSVTRNSVERKTREMREITTIITKKTAAISSPPGFSKMVLRNAYKKISMTEPNQTIDRRSRFRHSERKTATEAEAITARTPVAYGPAWVLI